VRYLAGWVVRCRSPLTAGLSFCFRFSLLGGSCWIRGGVRYDIRICRMAINVLTPRSESFEFPKKKKDILHSLYPLVHVSLSLRRRKKGKHAASVIQTSHIAKKEPASFPPPTVSPLPPSPFFPLHIYLIPISGPVLPLRLQQIATLNPTPTTKLKPTKPTIVPTTAFVLGGRCRACGAGVVGEVPWRRQRRGGRSVRGA
jgi:hypothetical protein